MKRLLLVVPVLVAGLALAVSASGSNRHGNVITVIEHATTDATTDTGAPGDSAGDLLTFANDVYDAKDKKVVGTDQGSCVRVVVGASYECTWTNLLKRGHIVVQGPFYDAKNSTLAITGGTGAYRDARGTMDLTALENGTKFRFAFHLKR
jgi:hypothetical protein